MLNERGSWFLSLTKADGLSALGKWAEQPIGGENLYSHPPFNIQTRPE